MTAESYPQEAVKFHIQAYQKPKNIQILKKTHVSFSGSPQKHPYDTDKVILVVDPFSTNTLYYEFNKNDIVRSDFVRDWIIATEEVLST